MTTFSHTRSPFSGPFQVLASGPGTSDYRTIDVGPGTTIVKTSTGLVAKAVDVMPFPVLAPTSTATPAYGFDAGAGLRYDGTDVRFFDADREFRFNDTSFVQRGTTDLMGAHSASIACRAGDVEGDNCVTVAISVTNTIGSLASQSIWLGGSNTGTLLHAGSNNATLSVFQTGPRVLNMTGQRGVVISTSGRQNFTGDGYLCAAYSHGTIRTIAISGTNCAIAGLSCDAVATMSGTQCAFLASRVSHRGTCLFDGIACGTFGLDNGDNSAGNTGPEARGVASSLIACAVAGISGHTVRANGIACCLLATNRGRRTGTGIDIASLHPTNTHNTNLTATVAAEGGTVAFTKSALVGSLNATAGGANAVTTSNLYTGTLNLTCDVSEKSAVEDATIQRGVFKQIMASIRPKQYRMADEDQDAPKRRGFDAAELKGFDGLVFFAGHDRVDLTALLSVAWEGLRQMQSQLDALVAKIPISV